MVSPRYRLPYLRAVLLCTSALIVVGPNAATARVGVTSATDGEPIGKPPAEAERILRIGIDVQANEVITTGANDRAHLVFLDGTSLTVGPNAQLTIDKFVYDPSTQKGDLSVTAAKGVLRLVGGKISKSNAIIINTPSATMGIRGGITVSEIHDHKTLSWFVFGDKLSVSANGKTQDLVRPGSQVITDFGHWPGPPTFVVQGGLNNILSQLEGRGGINQGGGGGNQGGGGNSNLPSGGNSADQGAQNFGKQNSGQGPGGNGPPGGPGTGGPPNVNNNSVTNAVSTSGQQQQQTDQNTAPPPPPTTTRVIVTKGRYIADPAYSNFNPATLGVTPSATNNQLLNSSGTLTNEKQLTLTLSGDGRTITLPWKTDTMGTGFPIGTLVAPNFGVVKGMGYVSANGDFFAYVLTDTSGKPVGFFGGTPTAPGGVPTTGIAAYDVYNAGVSGRLPFANATVGDDASLQATKVISKLYTAFSSNNTLAVGQAAPGDVRSTAMQATISINGLGASQKSYMGVFIGEFFQDANANSTAAAGGFNATYRLSATAQVGRLTSAASTPDVGGANAIYGQNASNIVFTPDKLTTSVDTSGGTVTNITTTRTPQASLNQPISIAPATDYYSVNGATLTSTPSGVGQNRTAQTLQGYVGGIVEQQGAKSATSTTRIVGVNGATPENVTVITDPVTNRASATIVVQQWDGTGTSASFQLGGTTGASNATSSFIDNSTYAVRDSDPSTTTVTSNGVPLGVTSRTTAVSYASAPAANLFTASGVTPCECSFLSWGWWSGTVSYANNSSYTPGGVDRLNFASYVVGNVTTVPLPNTGTATYNGQMVGNVVNGLSSYVAAGSYQNVWSFAAAKGTVTATFDGATFGGGLSYNTATTSGSNFATISSPSLTSGGRTLSLSGSFYSSSSSPVAGQAGSFGITGTGYKAGGTFAAQKSP
jgi:hypothetical protein